MILFNEPSQWSWLSNYYFLTCFIIYLCIYVHLCYVHPSAGAIILKVSREHQIQRLELTCSCHPMWSWEPNSGSVKEQQVLIFPPDLEFTEFGQPLPPELGDWRHTPPHPATQQALLTPELSPRLFSNRSKEGVGQASPLQSWPHPEARASGVKLGEELNTGWAVLVPSHGFMLLLPSPRSEGRKTSFHALPFFPWCKEGTPQVPRGQSKATAR